MLKLIDQKIRQAFSSAASQYDALTSLHKEIGRELSRKFQDVEAPARILEIGMGTGYFTNKLKSFFPEALVVGVDFAHGMVEVARQQNEEGFKIVEADATALPFQDNSFDIIASNAAYHWVRDLPQALGLCHKLLKPQGVLGMTLFGYDTFQELFATLEAVGKKDMSISRLPRKEQVEQALITAGFSAPQVSSERIKVRFPDLWGLIKWTKDIGANVLERDFFVGKDLLSRANAYYEKNYKDRLGAYATLEVIWVLAKK